MIHKIEAQGVKSGSVKHIKHPPIIVDCGLVPRREDQAKVEEKSQSCDDCAKDNAALSQWFRPIKMSNCMMYFVMVGPDVRS